MIQFKHGLYLVTDENLLSRRNFLTQVRKALSAGVDIIQLREKNTELRDRAMLGRALVNLAHRHGAKIVVNDDPWLALELGADGVHLGQADPAIELARSLLGHSALVGTSCYGDVRQALEMERRGADYVSFGAFYPSPTKPLEPLIPESVIGEAKAVLRVPVVAIGGIGPMNAGSLVKAGADALAIVSAAFSSRNAADAVRKLKQAIKTEGGAS